MLLKAIEKDDQRRAGQLFDAVEGMSKAVMVVCDIESG